MNSHPEWLALLIPFAFAASWLLATTTTAIFGGHRALLERFGTFDEQLRESTGWAAGTFRGMAYNGALFVGLGERGLHVAPNAFFRPPTMRGIPCIPWSELELVEPQGEGFIARRRGSRFRVRALELNFSIRGDVGRRVERRLGAERAKQRA